jgi:hypothetical protein
MQMYIHTSMYMYTYIPCKYVNTHSYVDYRPIYTDTKCAYICVQNTELTEFQVDANQDETK